MRAAWLLLIVCAGLQAGAGRDLLQRLATVPLDPAECYRIRDIRLARDEAQLFFTDGYLIFAKNAGAESSAAFFSSDTEGGDAEILLLPPLRGERRALSVHTGSPNMEEHFTQAAMVFSGSTYRELMESIRSSASSKKSPEMGLLLAERWSPVIEGLGVTFGLRVVADILSPSAGGKGFFAAALAGTRLGGFNLVFDPRVPEQLLIGSAGEKGFDVWSSFTSRSFRGKPHSPEFAISDFRIDTKLAADLSMLATTRITVKAPREERALPFEISENMNITSATVNGAPAEVLSRDRSGFFLVLPATPLAAGVPAEVVVHHEGTVIHDAGNHVFSVGARGSWYPNRGRQFARFDMTFHVPKELDLVAAGDMLENRVEGIERISRWKTSVPIRLAGFNLGIYDRVRTVHGDLTIEVCANKTAEASLASRPVDSVFQFPSATNRPGRRTQPLDLPATPVSLTPRMRLQSLAAQIGDVIEYFTARFGPLDLKRLEVTPVPGRFGQGFPGLIYLSTLSYLEPGEKAVASLGQHQQAFFTDLLHAHEAAHQWWGNIVTSAGYHDDWLMESLANYSALLYLERRKGTKAVDAILEDYRQKLLEKNPDDGGTLESIGPVVQGTRLDAAWVPVVYGKGTWILHMLRRQMGDEAFGRLLAALRKEYEHKALGTEEFRLFCANYLPPHSADSKLESFFDQWVYGTGIPELKVTSSLKARRVTGTITQSETDEDFAAEVPLEIQMGKGRAVRRSVTAGSEPVSFDFPLPAQPTKVSIDYRSILHR